MIKILVADDHSVVREGIVRIIERTSDLRVVGEAENGLEVLQKIRSTGVDVLLLDMSMPGKSGLELINQIRSEFPNLPILVFSMHPEDQYELRVLKAGASGYLTKRNAPEQLLDAIRKVYCGKKLLSPVMSEKVAEELDTVIEKAPHEFLTNREFQIMCLLASGKRIKDIANELSLSQKTVTTHRQRILNKMKISSNADLTRYCLERGIELNN